MSAGRRIGSTISLPRLDLEASIEALGAAGFDAVEVWIEQLAPGPEGPALLPAHAAAARDVLGCAGKRHAKRSRQFADGAFAAR